jgi:DNA invertase Pin-like site-specific DNA recombinase
MVSYAEANNIELVEGEFCDIKSGAMKPGLRSRERHGLYRALEAVHSSDADGLIVLDHSRLGRDLAITMSVTDQLIKSRRGYICVGEPEL